jgi:hypothetical protein
MMSDGVLQNRDKREMCAEDVTSGAGPDDHDVETHRISIVMCALVAVV